MYVHETGKDMESNMAAITAPVNRRPLLPEKLKFLVPGGRDALWGVTSLLNFLYQMNFLNNLCYKISVPNIFNGLRN
jgi:hypothetical protein